MENPERGQIVIADLEAKFDRRDVAYKTVENTPIEAAIFIPKTLISSSEAVTAPVLVHFHGGGLITGAVPDPFFLVDWLVCPSPFPIPPFSSCTQLTLLFSYEKDP